MNGECICAAWALRIDAEPWFHERAITYTCPAHGAVTIDDRPLIVRYTMTRHNAASNRTKPRVTDIRRWRKTA